MGYQSGHYYPYCNYNQCASGTFWFPDGSGDLRNQITAAYFSNFGRYGEQAGVEGHVQDWTTGGGPQKYGTINNMIYQVGLLSGETQAVASLGRHCGMSTGSCPPLPSATITANPSSYVLGGSSIITWSTSGVTSVSITNIAGPFGTSGSKTVSPTSTTTYILTGTGPRGSVTKSVTVTVTIPPPPTISSFSLSPSQICRGGTSTLSWSVSGSVNSVSINPGIGTVGTSGSRTVGPTSSTMYTISATGIGGSSSQSAFLTVKQPTSTNISSSNATIIRGQCTTLTWATDGDATSATISPGIGSVNINGNRQICPTVTTTYDIFVTGVCTNSTDSVTVIVYQPPTVDLSGPETLNYGEQGTLIYEANYADISLTVTPTYTYKNTTVTGNQINLFPGETSQGTIEDIILYNDYGPISISYLIVATGNGGQESKQITIPINIDETPDNFLVPESEDLFKEQEPVYTPDETITSYKIVLEDIDIPVEVKADKPILIDVNEQDSWEQIRRI